METTCTTTPQRARQSTRPFTRSTRRIERQPSIFRPRFDVGVAAPARGNLPEGGRSGSDVANRYQVYT